MGLQILALPSGLVPAAHDAAVTYQRNWDKHRKLPMIMFVITGGDHPIMVDTGTPDAAFVREHFGYTFERPDGEDPRRGRRIIVSGRWQGNRPGDL
jgi:N-acyl homoserine lactone hydrolase